MMLSDLKMMICDLKMMLSNLKMMLCDLKMMLSDLKMMLSNHNMMLSDLKMMVKKSDNIAGILQHNASLSILTCMPKAMALSSIAK